MILHRLYDLAVREELLDDPAFESQPVRFAVQLDDHGVYLGLSELIGPAPAVSPSARAKGGQPAKAPPNKGMPLPIPRPHGSPNAQGFARLFADAMSRVLPVTFDIKDPDGPSGRADRDKRDRSRTTFWAQIDQAATESNDPVLGAVQKFGRNLASDTQLAAEVEADCRSKATTAADRCTFAVAALGGRTILEHDPARAWFRSFFNQWTGTKQESGPVGVCQVTGEIGPLPTTHSMRISGVPGGLPTGVSLVSFDKDAFQSYGLDGAANAAVGYPAAEGYCRALIALIGQNLKGSPRSRLRLGDGMFLFWTREPTPNDPMALFEEPDPEAIERLITSAETGKKVHVPADSNDFYGLSLSGNAARAIVRGYLEEKLPVVSANLGRWFSDLRIVAVEKGGAVALTVAFPLWLLAASTALKSEDVGPDVYPRLLDAALTGGPLPDSILAACLGRLRAEGSSGFRPARLALIKFALIRRKCDVTQALDPEQKHPAYLCGRLLSIFEDIQYAALGDVNANVVDKFYGTFSAAPATVFSRLFANAQNHLRKVKAEKPGSFYGEDGLERQLTDLVGLLKAPPTGVLSLADQGYFALGYYHQKAKRFARIAENKGRKAESTKP